MFQEVGEALDRALGVDPVELSRAELADAVLDLQELAAKLAALDARIVAAFDAEQVWADRGAVNAQTWIRVLAKVSAPNAARQVRHARALRDLPETAAALAAGAVSSDHVTRILGVDNPRTREALRRDEPVIVGWARDLSFQRFCHKLAYWVRDHDPDGAEPDAADNRLSLSKTFDGAWRVDGWLDPLTGTVVDTELRRLTDELFQADWRAACERHGTDSPTPDQLGRTPAQRRADALAEMARRSAVLPATHTTARISATVLLGEDSLRQVCELLDGTVLHPADVARWLPISLVQRILYDGLDRPFAASANSQLPGDPAQGGADHLARVRPRGVRPPGRLVRDRPRASRPPRRPHGLRAGPAGLRAPQPAP